MIVEVFLFFGVILAYFIIQDRKPKGMPPGPWEIPFVGNQAVLEDYHLDTIKNYGPIVTTRLGIRTVVIFDYHLGKQAMASHDFENRPGFFENFSLDETKKGGVISSNGEQWQHDRRFVLRNLRNLGMGKNYLESAIHTEAQALVEDLKSYEGEAVPFPDSLKTVALNIIWQMVAGKRYDLRSKEVNAVYGAAQRFRDESSIISFLPIFFPILKTILPTIVQNKLMQANLFQEFLTELKSIIQVSFAEHEKKIAAGEVDGEDFMTEYMLEMKKCEDEASPMFYKGSLFQTVNDLFQAGSDTVYHQLRWTVYLMAKHPELITRIQKQIDEHVPKGQLISLSDKPNLPLVEAFAVEALRYGSILVTNVQREAVKDTHIGEYFIPKGTNVVTANVTMHYDPKYWENPEEFNPDRFVTAEGKFHAPKEGFFAFGSGRRQCVGELLARMEYFLYSAALIQNFRIRVPEGKTIIDVTKSVVGLRSPADQSFIYEYRF